MLLFEEIRYLNSFTGRVPGAVFSGESGNMSLSVIFTPARPPSSSGPFYLTVRGLDTFTH